MQHILPGNPPVPLILRKSARARRISLRISQLDGRVTLTLPAHISEHEAVAFAQEKEAWLRGHLANRGTNHSVAVGTDLPVEGQLRRVTSSSGKRAVIDANTLSIPGPDATTAKRTETFLKHMARDRLAAACDFYAGKLGTPYQRLSLRDTRSRWGSCSSRGTLMFSWRLIMAPPDVLRYVAAHEVAHLAHMDHSSRFWNVVTDLYGDYAPPRNWLRTDGMDLHRYRFDVAVD